MKTVKGNINEALRQVASYNNNNLAEAMSKKMPLDVFARTVGVGAKEQQWIMDNEDEFGKYYNNSALGKSWLSLSYPIYDKDYYFAFIGDSERENAKLNAEANRKLKALARSSLSNEEIYDDMEMLFTSTKFDKVGAGDTMSREELWRAVRHIRGDYKESIEEGKLGNIARALLDKMRKRAKKIRIGEDLDEMRHKFVFDKAVNLSKAEKIAQQLGMKTDSETGRDYYYLSVDDGGNSGNLLKFLKATDGLHEESIIEMKFNRDGKKIEITKSGPSTKPIFHLKINGKDHGKFDQEKKAMQYVASLKEEDNLNEARIVISTLMYDAITKLGLAQIMKKHDAYVNKQQTDKEYTTLSSPSPMFGRDLSNLIKKNSDKLLKILPEETQVMINEARIANYKPTKFEGKQFDRKKELKALKNMHNAIMKIAKMQDDMQYTAETGGTPRIGNPHAIHQSLRSAEQAIFDYMGGIERGHYDGIIDMDRD